MYWTERSIASMTPSCFKAVMSSYFLLSSLIFLSPCLLQFGAAFNDITSQVFAKNSDGILAAFGDFNSDKLTDVFRLLENRNVIEVLIAQKVQPYLTKAPHLYCDLGPKIITSVVPGDYDGDARMDVLLSLTSGLSVLKNEVVILWGNSMNTLNCTHTSVCEMNGQPLIMDYNSDMIPDIFGEATDGNRYVWLSNKSRTFERIPFGASLNLSSHPLRYPHSCAFVDLHGDGTADLFVTAEDRMEYWQSTSSFNHSSRFTLWKMLQYPTGFDVFGQSIFLDMDLDGQLEHVVPVCYDLKCERSAVIVSELKEPKWKVLFSSFKHNGTDWGFALPDDDNLVMKGTFPVSLRYADLDMDGYIDLLAVLKATVDGNTVRKAFVLQNVPSSSKEFSRTLSINWNMEGLSSIDNVHLATFYDVYENGIMDVVLLTKKPKGEWEMIALENNFNNDAYFIKVLVLSGYSDCPQKQVVAYGTNQPGATVCYSTTRPNGQQQNSCAVQLPQSAYFALQLPYSVFGLGQTPNFVDHLNVVVPGYTRSAERRQRDWTQIIPNSQIVIIPCPPDNPSKWTNKLFVTPSNLVILTLVALIGTCVFILIIIGILHWKEKMEDKREKLQEAHRFHFDAM